jgi:hypothetical protein
MRTFKYYYFRVFYNSNAQDLVYKPKNPALAEIHLIISGYLVPLKAK